MKYKIFLFIFLIIIITSFAYDEIMLYYIKKFDTFEKKDFNKIIEILDLKNKDHKLLYGSILIKKSKYEWFLPLKYYYIYLGMIEMKEVVKSDFDNLLYRYIRGKTVYEMLSFDFSKDIFINDFEYIYIRADEKFKNNFDFGEILYKLSNIYKTKNPKRSKKMLEELRKYKKSQYYRMIYNEE
ncbi:hypothetical protein JCM30566_02680 [Marinitoga arctica]